MTVREFRAGCQMPAELFLRLRAEARKDLQGFDCKVAISKGVANPVGLSGSAGAQLFDYLILADGLHLRPVLPKSNPPVSTQAHVDLHEYFDLHYLIRSDDKESVYRLP